MTIRLTLLSSMLGQNFPNALDRHLELGIKDLDLRDGIYGHWLNTLPHADAKLAMKEIVSRSLSVYCLSTSVFFGDLDDGQEKFTEEHNKRLDQIIPLIEIFRPNLVRLIAPQLKDRPNDDTAVEQVISTHPWVFDLFRTAVQRIVAAGARATIENEAWKCVLSRPREFTRFFSELDLGEKVNLTWDVQNQWATGYFPNIEMLDEVAQLVAYYHVKGGQHEDPSRMLRWNVALQDATWPVESLTKAVIARKISPVICLNPAQHGENKVGYNYTNIVERDITFLRQIGGIA